MLKKFMAAGLELPEVTSDGFNLLEYLKQANIPGWVYVGTDASGLYKIGRTEKNPAKREAQIRNMNPTFRLVGYVKADRLGVSLEEQLHAKFATRRVVGEWFRLTPEEAAEIIEGGAQ